MPEPVIPPATPPEPDEPIKPEEKPALDPSKSLSSQTKEIEKLLGDEPKKEEEEPKEEPKKPEDVVATPDEEEETEEDEEDAVLPKPTEVNTEDLPTWQKYILENLPDIQTVGHTGKGKDKIFTVKRVEDLPEGFEFTDKRAELSFSAALASQEVNARELLTRYQQQEQQQKYQEFQNQEAVDIQADIARLQKEGIIEAFKHSEDDPEFNDDPAVKEANAIYALYKKTNDSYIKDGRTYRITYEDAAYKYLGMKSRQSPSKPDTQKEREVVASRVSAPSSSAPEGERRAMPAGSTMQDVLRAYKLGAI